MIDRYTKAVLTVIALAVLGYESTQTHATYVTATGNGFDVRGYLETGNR